MILGAFIVAIAALLWVVWGGIQMRFQALDGQVLGLRHDFDAAVVYGVRVDALLGKAPTLEKTIDDTHVLVSRLSDAVKRIEGDTEDIKQQLTAIRQITGETRVAVGRVQSQMSQIVPLVPGLTELLVRSGIPAPKEKERR